MFYFKGRAAAAAALMLFACGISSLAIAGDFDWKSGGAFDAALGQGTHRDLAALDRRLPLEPRLPLLGVVCATLRANLTSAAFASPSATDPDIDSIAAVTANPLSSNPDTARVQAALNACQGGVVRLAAAGPNNAFLTGPLTLPSGVTLWVDWGVTLYGSRFPADYTDAGLVAGDECGNASKTTT